MKIAVASGKGGTGKTTVSISLALSLARRFPVDLMDCDVEEPNVHLFVECSKAKTSESTVSACTLDPDRCTACGACAVACRFNAIAAMKGRPLFFQKMCHACGNCVLTCPHDAISETRRTNGVISVVTLDNLRIIQGCLNVGEAMAAPLIREIKKKAENGKITIIDSPPGTTCSMISAVSDCDYAILVTEPTPFGLHDLKLAVATIRLLEIPFGVIVNQADKESSLIQEYCDHAEIPLLLSIPYKRKIAENYSIGIPLISSTPEIAEDLLDVFDRIHCSREAAYRHSYP